MKFLLPLLLMLANNLFAQCKYERNEIDEFEKVEVKQTKMFKVMYPTISGPVVWMSLGKISESYFVYAKLCNLNENICLGDSSELLILTDRGKVIRMKHNGVFDCTEYDNSICGTFTFNTDFETIKTLGSSVISKIRIYAIDNLVEVDVTKSNVSKSKGMSYFVDTVPCILN